MKRKQWNYGLRLWILDLGSSRQWVLLLLSVVPVLQILIVAILIRNMNMLVAPAPTTNPLLLQQLHQFPPQHKSPSQLPTSKPRISQLTTLKPVTIKPTTSKSTTSDPMTLKPTTFQPTNLTPTTQKPTSTSTSSKPTLLESTTTSSSDKSNPMTSILTYALGCCAGVLFFIAATGM